METTYFMVIMVECYLCKCFKIKKKKKKKEKT